MFAVCTGDTVDRAKSSDTVRHNHRADAVDSCIRIGRVGGVELVAISNPGRLTPVLQLLHESEVVVARHTKDVIDPCFLQTTKDRVSDGLPHFLFPPLYQSVFTFRC